MNSIVHPSPPNFVCADQEKPTHLSNSNGCDEIVHSHIPYNSPSSEDPIHKKESERCTERLLRLYLPFQFSTHSLILESKDLLGNGVCRAVIYKRPSQPPNAKTYNATTAFGVGHIHQRNVSVNGRWRRWGCQNRSVAKHSRF